MTTQHHRTFYTMTAMLLVTGALLVAVVRVGNCRTPTARERGTMPEVVVTAPSPNMIVDTVVVRPTSKNQVAGTMPDGPKLN